MAKRKTKNKRQKINQNHALVISIVIASVIVLSLLLVLSTSNTAKFAAPKQVPVEKPTEKVEEKVPAPTVTVPEKLPDLQVQLFSTYSGEIKQAIRITTDVSNKGDVDIKTNYKVTYGYEEKKGVYRIDYTQVGSVEVKAPHPTSPPTKPIVFLWIPEKTGVYDFKVCADFENTIKESNEENNCARTTITVKEFAKYA